MSRGRRAAAVALVSLLAAACPRGRRGAPQPSIPAGDAVYFRDGLGKESSETETEQLLSRGGFAHVFLPAIRLEHRADGWTAAEVEPPPHPLVSLPVILVIDGGSQPVAEPGRRSPDEALAAPLEGALAKVIARRTAFGRVEGVHLQTAFPVSAAESFGALATRVRKAVPPDLFLTCSLEGSPGEKERDELGKRLAPLDGFVAFLFGEGAKGDPASTDALGKPWWAGYAPAARGAWKDAAGSPKGGLHEGLLSALTDQPLAPLSQELSLTSEGASDIVFRPTARFQIAGSQFEPGDQISFRQPAVSELLFRFGSDLTGRRLVRGRLVQLEGASESERLFTLAALSDALLGHPLVPDLRVKVTPEPSGVRVEAENVSNHASVLSRSTNWIEVDVPPGQVRDVQLGGFDRFEVFDPDGRPVTPGRAARIRFHEVLVAPHERIEPATIVLRSPPPPGCCRFRQHLLAASGTEVTGDWISPPPPPTPAPKPTAQRKKRR